jgi:dTDP-4-dehydrorhamnose reductase
LADLTKTRETILQTDFDVLINAAAFTNVDLAEKEQENAFEVNEKAPRLLAEICRDKGARLIHFSTDYVFDGEKREPYTEQDEPHPMSVYGASKLAGEKAVLSICPHHAVVRVSWVFGPDRPSFVDQMIVRAREHKTIAAVSDKFSTPTYTRDIARMLIPVVAGNGDTGKDESTLTAAVTGSSGTGLSGYSGILHVANSGQCSWQEYAQYALDCCRDAGILLKASKVDAVKMSDMANWIARRPVHTVLATRKYETLSGIAPRSWREAVAEYVREFVPAALGRIHSGSLSPGSGAKDSR